MFWTSHHIYHDNVVGAWSETDVGSPMFLQYKKLGTLKVKLKKFNFKELSDLSRRVAEVGLKQLELI